MKTHHPYLERIVRTTIVVALAIGLAGCLLRITGGFAVTTELETFVGLAVDNVSVARCMERTDEEGNTVNECIYGIDVGDDGQLRTSTFRLSRSFGLFGLLVDPVIVQVPDSATFENATVTVGGGTAQDLRITETTSFEVTPAVTSDALPGRKFWIVELPLAVESELASAGQLDGLDFTFGYRGPPEPDNVLTIQAMFAGRVEIETDTFYVPLYPCTSDWSAVPDVNIPIAGALTGLISELVLLLEDNPDAGCEDVVYDFDAEPVNRAPTIVSTPVTTGTVNEPYGYDIEADDPDGDALAFSLDQAPTGMDVDPVSGLIEWTPASTQVGASTVTVRVTDPEGLSDTQSYTIEAAPAPTLLCDADGDGDVDRDDIAAIFAARNQSADPGDPRNSDGDGTITVLDARVCVLRCTLPLCASPPANRPPVIVSVPNLDGTEGEAYVYVVQAEDPDGDVVTFGLDEGPDGMTIDPASGLIQWTPARGQAGDNPVTVRASDPGGLFDLQNFNVDVVAAGLRVPFLFGLTRVDAEQAIANAGLTVGVVVEVNDDVVPAGQVFGQIPAPDTIVAPGTAVDLLISLGPA